MKKILCFGNPLLPEDGLAIEIGKELVLENYEFVICDSPTEIINHPDAFAIMDVSYGIKEVRVLNDFSKIKPMNISSLHDFDLSFFLKLMESIGKINSMKVLVIPAKINKNVAITQLKSILTKI